MTTPTDRDWSDSILDWTTSNRLIAAMWFVIVLLTVGMIVAAVGR